MKEVIQKEATNSLINNEGNCIITAATGAGKSKIAIDYLKHRKELQKDVKILIVVPFEKLRDENWLQEFIKWGALDIWDENVQRCCYISINKMYSQHFDIVILDEIHNVTENNIKFFQQNTCSKVIGLTATLPKEVLKKELLSYLKMKVVYDISLERAVDLDLVVPFKITVIKTFLNETIKHCGFGLKSPKPFYTTEKKAYEYYTKEINALMSVAPSRNRNSKLQRFIFGRMRIVQNSISKTAVAKYIIDNKIEKNEKTIIFCGTIKQAEYLCPWYYHSKTDDKHFNMFLKDEITMLSCVNALNEGMNIPELDTAIITQVSSKERHLVQRIGRVIRYRENHVGHIYIIQLQNTVDENWLNKAIENFQNVEINTINFTQLQNL